MPDLCAAARFVSGVFLGKPSEHAAHAHEASPVLWGPPALLAGWRCSWACWPYEEARGQRALLAHRRALHVSLAPAGAVRCCCRWPQPAGYFCSSGGEAAWTPCGGGGRRGSVRSISGMRDGCGRGRATAFSSRWQSGSSLVPLRHLSSRWGSPGSRVAWKGCGLTWSWRFEELQWVRASRCAPCSTASAVMVVRSGRGSGPPVRSPPTAFSRRCFSWCTTRRHPADPDLIDPCPRSSILLVCTSCRPSGWTGFRRCAKGVPVAVSWRVGSASSTFVMPEPTSPTLREAHNLGGGLPHAIAGRCGEPMRSTSSSVDFAPSTSNAEYSPCSGGGAAGVRPASDPAGGRQ